jgi:hypothetical protein
MSVIPVEELDQLLQSISDRHDQDAADSRRTYVDLVAQLAPPRTQPPPEGANHAAVEDPGGLEPDAEQVLVVLRAVGKTPADLREDVRVYADLRRKADLVAAIPQHKQERARVRAELEVAREEFKRLEKEWEGRLRALERQESAACDAAYRGHDARHALRELQHVEAEYQAIPGPLMFERDRRDPEKAAAEKANNAKRWDLQRRSDALEFLERVFFPPPPDPESRVTRYEGAQWWVGPKPDAKEQA